MANTALIELIEYLEKYKDVIGGTSVMIIDKCKALLPKERQYIIDAHIAGQKFVSDNHNPDSEEYYTQTFKQ